MNDSHVKFWEACRKFMREEVAGEAAEAEIEDAYPTAEMYEKIGGFGIFASRIGTGCMEVGTFFCMF